MTPESGSSPSRRKRRAEGRRFTALRLPTAPLWRSERRIHALTLAALTVGVGYLGWRVAFTLDGAPRWLAVALVAVEAWGIGQLALLAYQAWRVPGPESRAPVPSPDSQEVLVRMLDGDRDALERTLIGCARLAGGPPITVLGHRTGAHGEIERLARRHGARYVRGAGGGLREALRATSAELVMLLAAGEVPEPATLREASGRMLDPQVAAVQCAVEYANPHALTHVLAGRSEQELVTRVLGPSLGARGMARTSPSAVVVRRSVYAPAAPKASRSPDEEALVTEAAVLARGRSIVFQRSPVVRTLGPESVRDYVAAARTRAAAALRFLVSRRGPLLSRRMPTRVGLALTARASRHLSGVHRLALVGVVLATLVGGRLPFGTGVWEFAAVVAPVYLLIATAWLALGRGALDPGDHTRHALRTMGAHCRGALAALAPARLADALLRPRGSATGSLRQLGLLVAATFALDGALIARSLDERLDLGLPPMDGGWSTAAALAAGLVTVAFMLDVLQLMALRRQERRHYRLPVDLPATVGERSARCVDLTPGGLRLVVSGHGALAPGARAAMTLDVTDVDRSRHPLALQGVVRRVAEHDGRETLGLEIDRAATAPEMQERLAAYYWVVRPIELASQEPAVLPREIPAEAPEPVPLRTRAGRGGLRGASVAAAGAAAAALLPAVALGVLPQQSGTVDLASQYNVRIDMAGAGDSTGAAEVHPAGDVNGDGFDDVIVGSDLADPLGRGDAGAAYVIFGSASPTATIDAASLGSAGFRIAGAAAGDLAGDAAAAAGDVNGDGFDDVIVGAEGESAGSGAAYVVLGSAAPSDIDLASLGGGGFRIDDNEADSNLGQGVAGLGDLNGDGRDDVLVTASKADPAGRSDAGAAYVVFGTASTAQVDVDVAGPWGYEVQGAWSGDRTGWRGTGVGDVNGDSVPDMALAAPYADPDTHTDAGAAYVVFGKGTTTTVDLRSLGGGGFRIVGAADHDQLGRSISGSADLNGDSTPDVVVGTDRTDNNGRTDSGSAYVVFGTAGTGDVDAAGLGPAGYRIDGAAASDGAGYAVGASDDLNGDGLADVIVGAYGADPLARASAGAAYVVYGTASPTDVDLASLGSGGVEIRGAAAGDDAGRQVGGRALDVNGDGRPDALVGAHEADNNGRADSGSAYVVFGWGTPDVEYAPASLTLETGQAMGGVTPTIARTGSATFAVSPALPAGLSLNASTGTISGTPTAAIGRTTFTFTMTDLAGQDSDQIDITIGTGDGGQDAPPPEGSGGSGGSPPPASPGAPVAPGPRAGGARRVDLPPSAGSIPGSLVARYDPKRDAFLIRVRFKLRQRGLCRRACPATATIHERVKRRGAARKRASGRRASPWRTRARLGRTRGLRIRTRKVERFEIPVKRTVIGRRSVRVRQHLKLLVRLTLRLKTPQGVRRVRKDSLIRVSVKRYRAATRIRGGHVTTGGGREGTRRTRRR